MSDYPTEYSEAEPIDDAETWLDSRDAGDVIDDLDQLHVYQLEWLAHVAEDENKKAILRAEIEDRDQESQLSKDHTDSGTGGTEVWDSGFEVLDSFGDLAEHLIGVRSLEQYAKQELGIKKNKVIVPEEVRKICVSLQKQVNAEYGGKCEFGVLFKGEWTDEGFKVKPDYVVPDQKASSATVKYKEDLKKYRDEGYIVNTHSHPWSGESTSFSGTDDEHVNSHFDVALLFGGKAETIVGGIANVDVENGVTAQIRPEIVVEQPEEDLPEVETENIEIRQRKTSTGKSSSSLAQYRTNRHPHSERYYKGSSEDYQIPEQQQTLP